jgi:hypothetical protein
VSPAPGFPVLTNGVLTFQCVSTDSMCVCSHDRSRWRSLKQPRDRSLLRGRATFAKRSKGWLPRPFTIPCVCLTHTRAIWSSGNAPPALNCEVLGSTPIMAGTRIATLGVLRVKRGSKPFARFRTANPFAAENFCIVLFRWNSPSRPRRFRTIR